MRVGVVSVTGTRAFGVLTNPVTAGMVGATVELKYSDPAWDGLIKNVTFRCNGEVTILGVGEEAYIPAKVIETPDIELEVGIVGVATDGTTEVIPTLWANLGRVQPAAPVEPANTGENEPGIAPDWAQLEAMIGNLLDLATEKKTSAVAAINELASELEKLRKEYNESTLDFDETAKAVDALSKSLSTVRGNITSLTQSTAESFKKVNGEIGDLGELKTEANGSLVEAVNEVLTKAEGGADVEDILRRLADLEYVPLDITGVSNSVGTVLAGTVINSLRISWTLVGVPVSQSISSGQELTADQRSITLGAEELVNVRAENGLSHSFTVTARDARGKTDTGSTTVAFQNNVWWGSAIIPGAFDKAFVAGLQKAMTNTRKRTFNMDDAEGYYTWYVCPVRLGACSFKSNGLPGGLSLVDTVEIENELGYSEKCNVYRSGFDGQTGVTVEVS